MAWVISLLGAALAAGRGVSLWYGSGYIRLDWGQAETVAGTVALSAGIVTIALAAVLFNLRDFARRPARAMASGVGVEALHLSGEAEPPAASTRGRVFGKLATLGLPKAERAEPRRQAAEAVADLDEPFTDTQSSHEPVPADPTPLDPGPTYAPRSAPEAPPAFQPAMAAEAPTVAGRYEANGASYVLFSDGTIEVETDTGTHSFASMAALKEHIERQAAG